MRTCTKCGEQKSLSEFAIKSRAKGTHSPSCKECHRAYHKQRRAENREAFLEQERARRQDPVYKAIQREAHRRWVEANAEHVLEWRRNHYAKNRERRIREAVEWAQANPERHARSRRAYGNRKRGAPMDDAAREYDWILRHDPCAYCGDTGGEVDHITPLKHGGDGSWSNLTSACRSCNAGKNAKPMLVFLAHRHA